MKQKRDHAELLQSASANGREGRGDDSLISKLLREKTGLVSSMRSINDVIR